LSEPLSNTQLKHRLLGAGILVFIAVILIPLFLGDPKYATEEEAAPPPESGEFESKIQPLPGSAPASQDVAESGTDEVSTGGGLVLKKFDSQQAPASKQPKKAEQVVIEPLRLDTLTSQSDPVAKPAKKPVAVPKEKVQPKKVAATKSEPAKPKPATKKPLQATAVKSGWAVQAGIFSKPENAEAIAGILKKNGYVPNISDARASFGKAKRVWIGPFARKSEAQSVSKRLDQQTGIGGYVAAYPFKS